MAQSQQCLVLPHASPPAPPPEPRKVCNSNHPVHKTLASAANLANLLPTGTVLAFRTLTPSFSNKGSCQIANEWLTACLIVVCGITCLFSSFTDSFIDCDGKLYYGIATFKGLYIFNCESYPQGEQMKELSKYRIRAIDFVHAFVSLLVFLIFALGDSDVQRCFFPESGANVTALLKNLPLGAGVFSSLLFTLCPTTRRGIGYADMPASLKC